MVGWVFLIVFFCVIALLIVGIAIGRNVSRTGSVFGKYMEAPLCDVSGRVFVVTGSNTGIGKETAMGIASMGGKVYLACRRMDAAAIARREIIERTGNSLIETVKLDLGDFKSIRACVQEIERREPNGIHTLVNNAAYVANNTETIYGLTKIFVINHLGPFLLTNLLIPSLKKGAENSHQNSRIVIVASGAAEMAKLDMDHIDSPQNVAFIAYANSKLQNAMYSNALSKRLSQESSSITVNCLHPGWVRSEIDRNGNILIKTLSRFLGRLMAKSAKEGAQTSIYLATSPQLERITGKYFEHCRESKIKNPLASDMDAQERLWKDCARLISDIQ